MPPKKGKAPALHAKCDPIPVGTVIVDSKKTEITVQKEFAQGGFGRICDAKVKGSTIKHIIKFEPTGNGPLFVENHLFPRILTLSALEKYSAENKLKFLGLPHCVANGVYKDVRFLVMPKYDYTLEQLIKDKKGVLPLNNTVAVVLSVLDALQYVHFTDYAHGDIKAGNLMLTSKTDYSRVYLIDFGLAKKVTNPVEKDDPKKAHNGTALFTSMDAHRGCGPSFRGDIEILAHNVLLWLTGDLPWKSLESDPNAVQKAKADLLQNITKSIKKLVSDAKGAAMLIALYTASTKLQIGQKPDVAALKKAIGSGETASKRKRVVEEPEENGEESSEDVSEVPSPSRSRTRTKKELASSIGESTEDEKSKSARSRPRKAGAAIAAAMKGPIIYPGLSNKRSTDKSDNDDSDLPQPSAKRGKKTAPTQSSKSNSSRRRAPSSSLESSEEVVDERLSASALSDIENMAREKKTDVPAPPVRERLGRRAKENAPAILENSIIVGKKAAKSARAQKPVDFEDTEDEAPKKGGRGKKAATDNADMKPGSSKTTAKKKAAKAVKTDTIAPVDVNVAEAEEPIEADVSDAEEAAPAPATKKRQPAKRGKKDTVAKEAKQPKVDEENIADPVEDEPEAPEESEDDAPPPPKKSRSKKNVEMETVEDMPPAVKSQRGRSKKAEKVVPVKEEVTNKRRARPQKVEVVEEAAEENAPQPAANETYVVEKKSEDKVVDEDLVDSLPPPKKRGRAKKNPEVEADVQKTKKEKAAKRAKAAASEAELSEAEDDKPAEILQSPEPVIATDETPDLPLRAENEEAMEIDEEVEPPKEEIKKPKAVVKRAPKTKIAKNAEAAVKPEEPSSASPSKPVGIIPGVTKNMKSAKAKEAMAAKEEAEAVAAASPKQARGRRGAAAKKTEAEPKTDTEDVHEDKDDDAPVSPSKPIIYPGVTKNMKTSKAKAAVAAKEAAEAAPSKPIRGNRATRKAAGDAQTHEEKPEVDHNDDKVEEHEEPVKETLKKEKAKPKKVPSVKNIRNRAPVLSDSDAALVPAEAVDSDIVPPRGRKAKVGSLPSSPANPIIPGVSKNLKSAKAKQAYALKEAAALGNTVAVPNLSMSSVSDIDEPMEIDEEPSSSVKPSRKRGSDASGTSLPFKATRIDSPHPSKSRMFSASDSSTANKIIPGVTKKLKSAKAQEAYALKVAAEGRVTPTSQLSTDPDRRTPSFIGGQVPAARRGKK